MPYKLSEDGKTVVKKGGGKVPGGKHETKKEARDHLTALNLNVTKKEKRKK